MRRDAAGRWVKSSAAVRIGSDFPTRPEVLRLLADPSRARWRALVVYLLAMSWAAGTGEPLFLPRSALRVVRGTPTTVGLLTRYGFLIEHPCHCHADTGWHLLPPVER